MKLPEQSRVFSSSAADPYAAIRDLPRPVSRRHPPMARIARAAQFAPFSALSGYDDVIQEAGRLTSAAPDPGEEALQTLDAQLHCLIAHTAQHPMICVRHFVPDGQKAGGAYADVSGRLKRVDPVARRLYFTSGESIRLENIVKLESVLFSCLSEPEDAPDFPEAGLVISPDR